MLLPPPTPTLFPYTTLFRSTLDIQLTSAVDGSPEHQLRTYRNALNQLTALIGDLGREHDGVRLSALRSVRNYVEEVKEDRKSTRLNSSHLGISYAVFCLKKK